MTPGDRLHVPGAEYLLCAASIEQARLCFRFVRADLEPVGGYRFLDSATRIGITGPGNTKLRVLSSNGKTAMGIANTPVLVADEPGSWEVNGGQLMNDAITTAQGKPGSGIEYMGLYPKCGRRDGLLARDHRGAGCQRTRARLVRRHWNRRVTLRPVLDLESRRK